MVANEGSLEDPVKCPTCHSGAERLFKVDRPQKSLNRSISMKRIYGKVKASKSQFSIQA